MKIDPSIYVAHAGFWGAFGLTRALCARSRNAAAGPVAVPSAATEKLTAPFSRALLCFHMIGFATMYAGIGSAVFSNQMLISPWYQRAAGSLVIALGAALAIWALVYFRSWRFRAQLEEGHQLATGGPFAVLRHPIYMGLNLLALGSMIWIPTWILWLGFLLITIGSDLRGRSEEKLLGQAFGPIYGDYRARTARFLPGIY